MTLEEVKHDLMAKRIQLREYRATFDGKWDSISKYAETIATGRLQQLEMDIALIEKIGRSR